MRDKARGAGQCLTELSIVDSRLLVGRRIISESWIWMGLPGATSPRSQREIVFCETPVSSESIDWERENFMRTCLTSSGQLFFIEKSSYLQTLV